MNTTTTTAIHPRQSGSSAPSTDNSTDEYDLEFDSDCSDSETYSDMETMVEVTGMTKHVRKKLRRDFFSTLPASVLQQILSRLPPFQMLIISELSRKFYNFVVLGQDMNEVWFRLVKEEEAEQKKRLDWFKLKKLEQEQRSVQMMRSFSGSSTCSNMSSSSFGNGYGPAEDSVTPLSKQAQRLLMKKQEAAGKATQRVVKAMKRADRKKNWCKIYVDSILRGLGDDPLEELNQIATGVAKRPTKFQTIVLNEPLPDTHLKEYRSRVTDEHDENGAPKELSREAKTQAKIEKRIYYKSIRSKPKGKKAGQMDSPAAKLEKIAPWRQPEWSEQDQAESGDYY
ncbi:hypothetical protein BG011_008146 [Mortierella polycephala]|uniref:F-box domain-containing protein n=1 Tax=Mortierella polycephala TaxID=41804 RepID=A0A9P6PRR1_9FUNG|nr:hypothetical protein BG011_008146 [Mortierella polycephala]